MCIFIMKERYTREHVFKQVFPEQWKNLTTFNHLLCASGKKKKDHQFSVLG